jgi:BA14K-like protein
MTGFRILALVIACVLFPATAFAWIWTPRPEYTIGWGYVPPFGLGFDWKYPYFYEEDYQPAPPPLAVTPPEVRRSCAQRFRSYDPLSETYLGYDGLRHPCP